MHDDYLLTFVSVEYLSPREKYLLFDYFKSAEQIFRASLDDLYFSGIAGYDKYKRLKREKINSSLGRIINDNKIQVISLTDGEYPHGLAQIYDPPVALFIKGKLPEERKIAIVGSRKCSNESLVQVRELAVNLSKEGFCIVSGMARGIDSSAHWGALEAGRTIAVLGTGLDICYPPENNTLKALIEDKGCTVSEYLPGKRPTRYSFPARNRIISGMSEAVIVADAGERSGALITAGFALDQGKDVYVLGSEDNIYGIGSRGLYDDGAPLISTDVSLFYD